MAQVPADRVPVIVGVGEVTDRPADPVEGKEPVALMAEALRLAEADAGGAGRLLAALDSLDIVNEISWPYRDPVGPALRGAGDRGRPAPSTAWWAARRRCATSTRRRCASPAARARWPRSAGRRPSTPCSGPSGPGCGCPGRATTRTTGRSGERTSSSPSRGASASRRRRPSTRSTRTRRWPPGGRRPEQAPGGVRGAVVGLLRGGRRAARTPGSAASTRRRRSPRPPPATGRSPGPT